MGCRSKTAGTLALASATLAVFGTVAVASRLGGVGDRTVRAVVRSHGFVSSSDVEEPRLAQPSHSRAAAGATQRETPPRADEAPVALRATIALVDARSGLPITRGWLQRSQFGALDRRGRRHEIDDPRGRVDLVVEEASATVLVSAARYLRQEVRIDRSGPHEVRLERATSVLGAVLDGQSAPVHGASVRLEFLGAGLVASPDDVVPIEIDAPTLDRTGVDGRFAFTDLPPGTYRTVATIDGAEQVAHPFRVQTGEWVESDHWLDEATRVAVRLDGPDGAPAARARIIVEATNDSNLTLTRYTDDDGRAVIGPLAPGTYDVTALSDDGVLTPRSLTVQDDGRAIVDLELKLARGTKLRD